jgi:hypothetical protein
MGAMNGGLAALIVKEMAKEQKETSESKLREMVGNALRLKLDCPSSVAIPDRLVNGFMRATNLNPEATNRILQGLRLLAVDMADSVRTSNAALPAWIVEIHNESFSPEDSNASSEATVISIVNSIHGLSEVKSARRAANAMRSQNSFIRSVCRVMYTAWIDEVAPGDESISREWLDAEQDALINFEVSSIDDLQHWAIDVFRHFAALALELERLPSHSVKRMASFKVIVTYERAWTDFVNTQADSIFARMEDQIKLNIPTPEQLLRLFHRPSISTTHMRQRSNPTILVPEQSLAEHRQIYSTHIDRDIVLSEVMEDWNNRVSEYLSETRAPNSNGLNSVTSHTDAFGQSITKQSRDRSTGHLVNSPQATQDEVSIQLKFRDADGDSRSIGMKWAYLQASSTAVSHWVQSRQSLIGDATIDVALVEISRNGTVESHALTGKSLSKLEVVLRDLVAPTTPSQVEA